MDVEPGADHVPTRSTKTDHSIDGWNRDARDRQLLHAERASTSVWTESLHRDHREPDIVDGMPVAGSMLAGPVLIEGSFVGGSAAWRR